MFPNRIPMGSNTSSPEPLVYFSFIHVRLPESPKRSPPTYIWTKTCDHHPRSPTQTESLHTMVCDRDPQGVVKSLLSVPQCHAAVGTIPSTLACVDQSPVSQHMSRQPHQGIPSTTVTASHVTQGRAE